MPVDLDAPNRAAMRLFGQEAQDGGKWTYTAPQNGPSFDIDVIYDEAWATLQVAAVGRGAIAPLSTTKPAVSIRVADIPQGSSIQKNGSLRDNVKQKTYSVADAQPDGMGFVRLTLNKTN